jgi:hypothetical protein
MLPELRLRSGLRQLAKPAKSLLCNKPIHLVIPYKYRSAIDVPIANYPFPVHTNKHLGIPHKENLFS